MRPDCAQAQIVAGAIALGEATDDERDVYRRHLSVCPGCIAAVGGEREIERTIAVIATARDAETWQPELRAGGRFGASTRKRRFGIVTASATAMLLALAAYALFVVGSNHSALRPPSAIVTQSVKAPSTDRWEERVLARLPQRHMPRVRLDIVHNVVTLKLPPTPAPLIAPRVEQPRAHRSHVVQTIASLKVADAGLSMQLPSERDRRSIAALRTVPTAAPPAQRAESLAVVPSSIVIHDVFPLGGENAIAPRPEPIAYYEGAEGTTAFEVSVDERGSPVKCTITKASGYLVLDDAVCRAAMRARYSPRTIDGRPVQSVYRDAFTFRISQQQ